MKSLFQNLKFINQKGKREMLEFVEKVNLKHKELNINDWKDEDFPLFTEQLKYQISKKKDTHEICCIAFAIVKEALLRVKYIDIYDVQLMGGYVLSSGDIAEMATGEGKTYTSFFPAYFHSLYQNGVHIITSNQYLAQRDYETAKPVFTFLGVSTGIHQSGQSISEKKIAYQSDITFGIASEFGFDYLRDHMANSSYEQVQRSLHYAIIDEADSILLDEAKTPLIIAEKDTVHSDLSRLSAKIISTLKESHDFIYDREARTVYFTDLGIKLIESMFGIHNLYDYTHAVLFQYLLQALRAQKLYTKDKDYIIQDDEIVLIDNLTGRPMNGKTLNHGLHQALQAKHQLPYTSINKTVASITIQNYFRLYDVISGMTGTAKTDEPEFKQVYRMSVYQIPRNRKLIRNDLPPLIFSSTHEKFQHVINKASELQKLGQPVLIGTTSVQQSELLSCMFQENQIKHLLLNANTLKKESELIEQAGGFGQITIATNMAGRGTDIRLDPKSLASGGLFVIGTELHFSRRIDYQLIGRAGRQGEPGFSQFYLSIEDELWDKYATEDEIRKIKPLIKNLDNFSASKEVLEFLEKLQLRSEGIDFTQREFQYKTDSFLHLQRLVMYDLKNKFIGSTEYYEILLSLFGEWVNHFHQKKDCIDFSLLVRIPYQLQEIIRSNKPNDLRKHQTNLFFSNLYSKLSATSKEALVTHIMSTLNELWKTHSQNVEYVKDNLSISIFSKEDPMLIFERDTHSLFQHMIFNLTTQIIITLGDLASDE